MERANESLGFKEMKAVFFFDQNMQKKISEMNDLKSYFYLIHYFSF